MKTVKNRLNFLVLVPHKDTRGILQKMEGIPGTFPFPCVAPLALLSQPLRSDELKHIAHLLREAKGTEKFELTEFGCTAFPTGSGEMNLCGPKIDLSLSPSFFETIAEKIKIIFSPVLIGACLIPKKEEEFYHEPHKPHEQDLSFRAAAVANMYWQPYAINSGTTNNEEVFKWEIDKLSWLPKQPKLLK